MSSFIEDITKLQTIHVQVFVGTLLAVVAPGYLMVLHFWPKLFFSLDNLKLFFFVISLSLPVLAMNTLAILGSQPFNKKLQESYYAATIFSFVMLYGCLLAAWFWKLSVGQFIEALIAIEICCFAVSFYMYMRILNATKTRHQQTISPD